MLAATVLTTGLALAVPQPARAELKAPTIAVVDVQKILQESTAAQGVQKAIEAQRETYQKEISALEEKLRTAEAELRKQQTVLSADAFAGKRRDFEKQVSDVQRTVQTRKRALDTAMTDSMNQVQKTMVDLITEVAKEQGANVVLARHQVVLVETNLDVTDVVLDRLNKKLPKVAVTIPKQ
ncbi:Skp family chaperone for outer membrane proteins [Azospirillum fermentarium]|uniref:OmpH family outer membrane protein n=1 Tax=Azospirillum fermentarium TaxID=1233114 RepID=UPI002227432A|nr:OmpH family outer membrane protein [Azospirillum fermentarium]MCW2249171.1 Skp family chaperone for outer membrane proteins [Azospirillum fermentarium]